RRRGGPEPPRDEHRDQPLGRPGGAQRAVRGAAVLRGHEPPAVHGPDGGAHALAALGAGASHLPHGPRRGRRPARAGHRGARLHHGRAVARQRAGPHHPVRLPTRGGGPAARHGSGRREVRLLAVTRFAGGLGPRFFAVLLAIGVASVASATDPDPALSPYVRERWAADRGFPGGTVQAISQTADGYLWLATERGLFRFDGQTFRPFRDSRAAGVSIPRVLGLVADGRGNLWIRLDGPRLLRYHDGIVDPTSALLRFRGGRFESVPALEPVEDAITAMASGRGGALLVTGL